MRRVEEKMEKNKKKKKMMMMMMNPIRMNSVKGSWNKTMM